MIHFEYLRKDDEMYEVRHDNCGNAIHVYVSEGEAVIFPTLNDLVRYVYLNENVIDKCTVYEGALPGIYDSGRYDYNSVKNLANTLMRRYYK
jgi:hypothetical protein